MRFQSNSLVFGARLRLLYLSLIVWTGAASAGLPLPKIRADDVIDITNAPCHAKGDGVTTNPTAIQNAINAATLGGLTNGLTGGLVKIQPGVFLFELLKLA